MRSDRHIGLDVIRACAILFVLSVHFFLNTKFYETPITNTSMYIQTFIRMGCIMCVPLFLTLTGYLQRNKLPNRSYFKKIIPILVVYLFYSILCIFFRVTIAKEKGSFLFWISAIENFTADPYSWYIQLYIGLFLLSPFLNLIYNNLITKKQKIGLIFIVLIMTSFPAFFNGRFNDLLHFPTSWRAIYPISYYFIGCYISEYKPKVKKLHGILLLLLVIGLETMLEVYGSSGNGNKFSTYIGEYDSLLILIQAVIFFVTVYDLSIKNSLITKIISLISILSLDIYLVSCLTDKVVYKTLLKYFYISQEKILLLFIPAVFSTFFLAFSVSAIRHKIIQVR